MEIIVNCPRCGEPFIKTRDKKICPKCFKEEEDKFSKVKDYLYSNPLASMIEVVKETEVEEKLVMKWLQDGRLIPVKKSNISYPCRNCGELISTGKFCKKCASRYYDLIQKEVDKMKQVTSSEANPFASELKNEMEGRV
jgi:flagellar operon protein (TIGR03826 family)